LGREFNVLDRQAPAKQGLRRQAHRRFLFRALGTEVGPASTGRPKQQEQRHYQADQDHQTRHIRQE
jgi:hypothetical protein